MKEKREDHTVRRYDGELNQMRTDVLKMGLLTLQQLQDALAALKTKDMELANQVVRRDKEVNKLEMSTDADIFNLLARRCPMASDLRSVLAATKIISNLERIGDEAAKIAHFTLHLHDTEGSDPGPNLLRDVFVMGQMAEVMLRRALDVLERLDDQAAKQIREDHRELDLEFQAALRRLLTYIMEDARCIGNSINVVLMIKALERIGDHAQNIAEFVIFQVEGEDIRHIEPDFGEDFICPPPTQ